MLPAPGEPGESSPTALAEQVRIRILRHRGPRLATVLPLGRISVRLPVVELEPGRRADLLLGPGGVVDVRQPDGDLVAAEGLDLRLGDTELVDALAHDVDRAAERGRVTFDCARRLALVDELDATLQVEPEDRLDAVQGTTTEAAISPATRSRTKPWRWRSVMSSLDARPSGRQLWLFGVSTTSTPP